MSFVEQIPRGFLQAQHGLAKARLARSAGLQLHSEPVML